MPTASVESVAAEAAGRPGPQVGLLCAQLRRTPAALIVADLFLAWLLMREGVSAWILAWVAASLALQIGRAMHVPRLLAGPAPAQKPNAWTMTYAWFFAIGVARALPVLIQSTFPSEELRFLVTAVTVGLAAGGVSSSAGIVPAYLAWVTPVGAALGYTWLGRADFEGVAIAILLLVMLLLLTMNARSYGAALRQMGEEAERANAQQQQALAERRRADEERNRAAVAVSTQTQFFADASHDLRQPLASLRWFGDAVLVHARQLNHEDLLKVGEGIGRALEEAEPLVEKYLDIAKLEAGAVQVAPQRIEPIAFVEELRETFAREASKKELTIVGRADETAAIHTDPEVLRRIVCNLMGNAVKFTPPGGTVTLEVAPSASPGSVRISVADTGVGIASADQGRVFEDFYQVGNPGRNRSKGVGLGLAIVRRQAALLGTTLRLHSQPGKGSCFEFDLPGAHAAADGAQRPAGANPPGPASGSGRVLVVDDEPAPRQALAAMLGALGWHVLGADSTAQARELLGSSGPVDALLVDFRLQGGCSGLDVIRELRSNGCDAPAIVITGDTSPAKLRSLAEAGLPVLHKPVSGDRLLAKLAEAMNKRGGEDETRRPLDFQSRRGTGQAM